MNRFNSNYDLYSQSAINAYHNARNPGNGASDVYNSTFWCSELISQLTCVSVAKDELHGELSQEHSGETATGLPPSHVVMLLEQVMPMLGTRHSRIQSRFHQSSRRIRFVDIMVTQLIAH